MKNLISILTVALCMVFTSNSYAGNVKLRGKFENVQKDCFVEVKVSLYDDDLEAWIQLDYYKVVGNDYSVKFITSFDYKVTFIMVNKVTGDRTEKNLYHEGGQGENEYKSNYMGVDFNLVGDCVMEQNEFFAYEFNRFSESDYPEITARL